LKHFLANQNLYSQNVPYRLTALATWTRRETRQLSS